MLPCALTGVDNNPDEDYAKLKKYCDEKKKFQLEKVLDQENATLLVDDAQLIYHVSEFWAHFKGV